MSESYDEILGRMNDKFYEISGKDPDESGDIGVRMKLLAGEIYSLECNLDWIKNAMFVSTAQGEALERHAAQRGISRHMGSKAGGTLYVSLDTPLEYDVIVPEGSVFTTTDGTLNFISTGEAVIYRGTGGCFVDVEAQYSGCRYNLAPESVTTVVTYFSSGINVTNSSELYGGTDDESDEELRNRIIDSYRNISDGFNISYYKKLAESVEGVYSANIVENIANNTSVNIYIAKQAYEADNELINSVQEIIDQNRIPGVYIMVHSAELERISVSVNFKIENGYPVSKAKTAIENAIRKYFLEMRVGKDFVTAELGSRIMAVDGVKNYSFVSTPDQNASVNTLFKLQSLTVTKV